MNFTKQVLRWTPTTVSWLSLFIMGVVVAGVGLTGATYVVEYLHERMTDHGYEHNQEISQRLKQRIALQVSESVGTSNTQLRQAVDLYGSFGYRVFVLTERGEIVADSLQQPTQPLEIKDSWLADLYPFVETRKLTSGKARATDEENHPLLIWMEEVAEADGNGDKYYLGIASDQHKFNDFLWELHWHLDAVLLSTYILIGLMGVFAMRGIGRAYERRLEALVNKRTQELEAAHEDVLAKTRLATIGQTASVLAHEMRNPLASIKLALSGMSNRDTLQERTRRRVELVVGEVDRLDSLLSQTLDYARPVLFSDHPVRFDQLLTMVIEQQQPLLDQHRLRIRRVECGECLVEHLDEAKMYQALLNVLKNAVEASPDGGEILVRLVPNEEESLDLLIANEGDAPDQKTLDQAFDIFYTTKPRGSGLGLGLVKRIVEEHGGRVSLSVDKTLGTCFSMHLPRTSTGIME